MSYQIHREGLKGKRGCLEETESSFSLDYLCLDSQEADYSTLPLCSCILKSRTWSSRNSHCCICAGEKQLWKKRMMALPNFSDPKLIKVHWIVNPKFIVQRLRSKVARYTCWFCLFICFNFVAADHWDVKMSIYQGNLQILYHKARLVRWSGVLTIPSYNGDFWTFMAGIRMAL